MKQVRHGWSEAMREKRLAEIQAWLEENKAVISRLEAAIARTLRNRTSFGYEISGNDGGKNGEEWLES